MQAALRYGIVRRVVTVSLSGGGGGVVHPGRRHDRRPRARPARPRPAGTPPARGADPRRATHAGQAWDDDIFSEAAAAAFWQTLSLPPLLLGLFGS